MSEPLIAALDVQYAHDRAYGACVMFEGWSAQRAETTFTLALPAPADYVSGAFYKRELPVLLALLEHAAQRPDIVIVDGYVWLDGARAPGLGAHLHEALDRASAVVGVAKSPRLDDHWSAKVLRGESGRPLYVTAAGLAPHDAANAVRAMHGGARIPALLHLVDRCAREAAADKAA